MLALLLLALALAADAFAVALVRGAAGRNSVARAVECGIAFGLAQGVMPLAGWGLGALFAEWIAAVDHWIAFGLLALLGARMLHAAATGADVAEAAPSERGSHYLGLMAAAIATSIDAAAAGLTLELFPAPVWLACLVIGLVTAVLSTGGFWFASRIGPRFGRAAEAAGGLVLIALGVKILAEHLG